MFKLHFGGWEHSTLGNPLLPPGAKLFLARKDDLTFAHQVREYEPGDVRGEGHLPIAGAAGANIMMVLGTVAL